MTNRRDVIATALLAPLSALGPRLAVPPRARVRRGEPGWPAPEQWAELGSRLEGALLPGRPLFAACASDKVGAECAAELELRRNPYFIGDHPGGTQVSGWVDAWTPQTSPYAVAARSSTDVAAAVNFARAHNVRLVVKGGGHSYQGTSNAPDSLLVWTRRMNRIELHDAFVPQGCEGVQTPRPGVTIEAGAMWMDAYHAVTTEAGRYVQGGGCGTVGVAGLIQSGGFGSFSKAFGLASASLLEAEIVTADGTVRVANACSHPDLFWALKGGGGGSWGVVTRVTLQTHELPDSFGVVQCVIRAGSDAAYQRLLARFVDFYAETLCNPRWGEQARFGSDNTLTLSMVFQGLDQSDAESAWTPFLERVTAPGSDLEMPSPPFIVAIPARHMFNPRFYEQQGLQVLLRDTREGAPAHHAWWAGDASQVGALIEAYESLWLPGGLLERPQRRRLAEALLAASRHWPLSLHFNKGLAGAAEPARAAARQTAINPKAIDAFALAIAGSEAPQAFPGLPAATIDVQGARARSKQVQAAMRALAGSVSVRASYVSESNFFEPDWQRSFWGDNYRRLLAIKKRYDPDHLFVVRHGVGSES